MNRRYPRYPDDADYQTNAPSYYEDLARKQKLIKMLAEKIWEYENTLNETLEQIEQRLTDYILENDSLMNERLENWDQRIEEMPEEMRSLFVKWLNDGTLEEIINHDVLGNKADQSELDKTNEKLKDIDKHVLKTRLSKKYRGSSVMLAYHPDETQLTFSELLDKLENDNVNTVSICPRYWADNDTSEIVGFRTSEIVDIPYIVDLCSQAKNKGFNVLLKPHVSGEGFTSYNSIQPKDPEKFIQSYSDRLIELFTATNEYVDLFSITNEMDNQTKVFPNLWINLIDQLRTIKRSIKLTNASRPDDLLTNVFLNRLDYIGANLYSNIGGDLSTPIAEQERNMLKTSDRVNIAIETALKYGKPLMITEVGTQPYLTGLTNPESWTHAGVINYSYQSRYYEVVLKNLIESPLVIGTMIWQSAGVPLSGSFGFVNNPSEETVRKIYGGDSL